jgi:GDPmannose 4,6-dehydratase
MRRALIVGSAGQDGRILFDRLAGEACAVLGLGRDSVRCTEDFETSPVDVGSRTEVTRIIERWRPDEVYYLAAVHQASEDAVAADVVSLFQTSLRVHLTGLIHFLDAIKEQQLRASLFYAASSLVFGDVTTTPQNEETPFRPGCVYGITKAAGVHACRFYRETHGVHASTGLLFNHESPLRRQNFVSQKIVRAAAAIANGHSEKLVLGELQAQIDWGYAPDFVDAMLRIVRHSEADDYVVATGETHSVQDFVEIAFGSLGLDWRAHVIENRSLLTRPHRTRVGDARLLRKRTGWRPSVTFPQMVEILIETAQREHVS